MNKLCSDYKPCRVWDSWGMIIKKNHRDSKSQASSIGVCGAWAELLTRSISFNPQTAPGSIPHRAQHISCAQIKFLCCSVTTHGSPSSTSSTCCPLSLIQPWWYLILAFHAGWVGTQVSACNLEVKPQCKLVGQSSVKC